MSPIHYVALSVILFVIGGVGVLVRRNAKTLERLERLTADRARRPEGSGVWRLPGVGAAAPCAN